MSDMDNDVIPRPYPITTGRDDRAPLDREARRYFVYTLSDGTGAPVYVGRSCNVAARIRGHHSEATHPYAPNEFKAEWLGTVREIDMVGPFTWGEAVDEERRQIRAKDPRGNRIGRRPAA